MPVDPSSVALEKDRIHNDKRTSVRYNCKRAVKRGLPVIDFVRTVWRFTPDMLPEGQPYRLWRTTVNRFLQQGSERESYTHFASIITDLLAQLYPDASVYGASSPLRKLTPIMKLSLWARGNGKFAAIMIIVMFTFCSFLGWNFWTQVRQGRPTRGRCAYHGVPSSTIKIIKATPPLVL